VEAAHRRELYTQKLRRTRRFHLMGYRDQGDEEVRYCAQCKWHQLPDLHRSLTVSEKSEFADCLHPKLVKPRERSIVSGELPEFLPTYCVTARASGKPCGPSGLLFEPMDAITE
jgi:hypothetical protein